MTLPETRKVVLRDLMMAKSWRRKRAAGRICTLLLMVVVLGAVPRVALADSESDLVHEYQVKAAFMYNFLMFVDGLPFQQKIGENSEDGTDDDRTIVIGILGEDPFREALMPLQDKRVKDHKVVIKRFKGMADLKAEDPEILLHPQQEALGACDLLFISTSEEACLTRILSPLAKHRVLTVSEIPGFVERGGMIGLMMERHKVRFEVNVAVAKQANLAIRSKLLRLAQRVIEEDEDGDK